MLAIWRSHATEEFILHSSSHARSATGERARAISILRMDPNHPANDLAFSCGRRANADLSNFLEPLRAAFGSCNGLLDDGKSLLAIERLHHPP
jgi:hypothetical protein